MKRLVVALIGAAALVGCTQSHTYSVEFQPQEAISDTQGEIIAEGSSAADRAMDLYAIRYAREVPGARLAYTPTGTGTGVEKFIDGTVDMAASDSALNPEQAVAAAARCGGSEAWHVPLAVSSMSMAFRLDGVNNLVLNSQVIAGIYKAEILTWNDPAIAALNPGVALPELPITPIYRIDPSGTTDTMQRFLQATTNGAWNTTGVDYAGFGGIGATGSSGVVGSIAATNGAIGYLESGFARDARLSMASIDFGMGPVAPSIDTVVAAAEASRFVNNGHNLVLDTAALYDIARTQPATYPLLMPGYTIVCSAGYPPEVKGRISDYLNVALANQGKELRELGYIPLGVAHTQRVADTVAALG